MRIRKNDQVLVLTGADGGKRAKRGRVVSVDKKADKVKVEGVNVVRKAVRRSRRNPQGGLLSMEMPIPVSNVQLVCPSCNMPTRIGVRFADDGTKYRVCKKCRADIGVIAPPKK